jgi:preprotein translocase subunit SecG
MNALLGILLLLTSIFLILLILIQRGRGGGLAGAFGGMGGQSAFGTKAGDLFTRVTIGVTFFWIVLCLVSIKVMGSNTNRFSGGANSQIPLENSGPALPGNTTRSDAAGSGAGTGTGNATQPAQEGASKDETSPPTSGVDNSTGGALPAAPAASGGADNSSGAGAGKSSK